MHPAISVIFFTVTSGAGFGLIALLGLGWPAAYGPLGAFAVCALAGGLAVAGLIASTFHLGHPERALRAFSQWRSSWLSREGVVAVATLFVFAAYGLIWMVTGLRIDWLGALAAIGAVATVFATSMIYAQLKTVPHWHTALTPAVYLGFAFASAWLLAGAVGTAASFGYVPVALWSMVLLLFSWGLKVAWWRRAEAASLEAVGHSPESATGLGAIGKVKLLDRPHSGGNYLTKEMVHRIGRKHATVLRFLAIGIGGLVPFLIACAVYLAAASQAWLALAFAAMMAGLFAERWLFFAEAQHSVSLYYD